MNISIIRNAISASIASNHTELELNRPRHRPENLSGTGRVGAVLLLLYRDSDSGRIRFVLTKRRDGLRDHPGQISLPGGGRESNESLQQTAVREAMEEISAAADSIEMTGQLESVYIPPSDFTIYPFVGWYHATANFVRQQDEVAELIQPDLDWLLSPESLKFGRIIDRDDNLESRFFQLGEHQVWGATAKVLIDFRDRIWAYLSPKSSQNKE